MDFMGLIPCKKELIIKKNLFLSPFQEKGKEDATSQVNLFKAKKKNGINLKRYGINRILLPLSIASIFFQACFVF